MFDWLFGSGRQTNYDDTNKLYGQFNDARTAADSYFDKNIAGKDWNTLGAQDKARLSAEYGDLQSKASGLSDQYKTTNDLFNTEEKSSRNNFFGNGLIGALLNPFAQTFDAGMDLATGNYKGRDVASDLGALGESALTFLPGVGAASKVGKVGKALTSVPGLAATGAGFGGLEALRQGGSETTLQDVLGQAGTGALFGGAIPVAGKFLRNRGSKVLSRDMTSRGMDPTQISQTMGAIPNRALYSTAMRSFVPKSTFGKVALGGGALYGGNMLMNSMQQPQNAASGGQITDEQLYNYLISQGLV